MQRTRVLWTRRSSHQRVEKPHAEKNQVPACPWKHTPAVQLREREEAELPSEVRWGEVT